VANASAGTGQKHDFGIFRHIKLLPWSAKPNGTIEEYNARRKAWQVAAQQVTRCGRPMDL